MGGRTGDLRSKPFSFPTLILNKKAPHWYILSKNKLNNNESQQVLSLIDVVKNKRKTKKVISLPVRKTLAQKRLYALGPLCIGGS